MGSTLNIFIQASKAKRPHVRVAVCLRFLPTGVFIISLGDLLQALKDASRWALTLKKSKLIDWLIDCLIFQLFDGSGNHCNDDGQVTFEIF